MERKIKEREKEIERKVYKERKWDGMRKREKENRQIETEKESNREIDRQRGKEKREFFSYHLPIPIFSQYFTTD